MSLRQRGWVLFLLSVAAPAAVLFGGVISNDEEGLFIGNWFFGFLGGMGFVMFKKNENTLRSFHSLGDAARCAFANF